MSDPHGAPPRGGWARFVVELHVNDLDASLDFWRGVLGFTTAYARPSEGFHYLEHAAGMQVMLCRRNGRFETGPMPYPLGQGAMMQIYFDDLAPVLEALAARSWPAHTPLREIWRRTGDVELGQREIFVQDPDGYLLMLAQNIGTRPLSVGSPSVKSPKA